MSFDFISGVTTAISAAFASAGNPLVWIPAFIAGGLAGGDAKRSARNKARSAFNAAQRDRDQMIQSATAPHKIVYGRARVSGPIAYAQSTGSKGEIWHQIILLAGHECDAVETVYFNDTALTLDGSGNVTNTEFNRIALDTTSAGGVLGAGATTAVVLPGTMTRVIGVTSSTQGEHNIWTTLTLDYTVSGSTVTITRGAAAAGAPYRINYEFTASSTPLVQVKAYLGTSTQTADAGLISASGGKWTSAHRLRGLCYLYVRLEYDQDTFGAVGLPDISAVVRGRKVWDPRTSTTAWRDNAALCAADYLRSYMGATAGEVPDAELTVEADACDELVTIATGVTEARYTCNGVLSTEEAPRANLDAIVESMAGTIAWAQGRYVIRAGRHLSPEFTLTEDMLASGAISIQPDAGRTDLFNRVTPKYVEPAKGWATIEAPAVTSATYVSDDGGLDLPLDVTLDMVTGAMRAQRLAKIMLERNRQGMRVQLTCNLRAYDLAPGSVVALTIGRYGWSAKLVIVVDRTHDLGAGTVSLTLRETAAAVWDWAFGAATTVDLTPNTSLPNAFAKPAALTGLAAASGTTWLQRMGDGSIRCRANVSWAQTGNVQVMRGGRIEVQFRRADESAWVQAQAVPGDAVSAVIGPLQEGVATVIGVRAVSYLGQAGPWAYFSHTPVGKNQAPADVSGLACSVVAGAVLLTWSANQELDYRETELRIGTTWATATVLHIGPGTLYPWAWPGVGSFVVLAKHRDTSANESSAAAVMPITVNADGTISRGVTSWVTGAGAAVTWSYTGGSAYWLMPAEAYLVNTPNIADAAVGSTQIGGGQVTQTLTASEVAPTDRFAAAPLIYTADTDTTIEISFDAVLDWSAPGSDQVIWTLVRINAVPIVFGTGTVIELDGTSYAVMETLQAGHTKTMTLTLRLVVFVTAGGPYLFTGLIDNHFGNYAATSVSNCLTKIIVTKR